MMGLASIVRKKKLKLLSSRLERTRRFNRQKCISKLGKRENGVLPSQSEWKLTTPDLSRNEDILVFGSNTFDGKAVSIRIKWRPQYGENLTTLISKISLDLGNKTDEPSGRLDYEETHTRYMSKSDDGLYPTYVGKNLKLQVLNPCSTYRLEFRGLMRKRHGGELVFVRLRLLILSTGKIYDFKHQFDVDFMQKQLESSKLPLADYVIVEDIYEQTIQIKGTCKIEGNPEEHIYCWGFHGRRFNYEPTNRKDIFVHFPDGIYFHIGVRTVSKDGQYKKDMAEKLLEHRPYMMYGHGCLNNQISYPLQSLEGVNNWNELETKLASGKLKLDIKCEDKHLRVELQPPSDRSLFFEVKRVNKKSGFGLLLVETFESDETKLITDSVLRYKQQLGSGQRIDLNYLDIVAQNSQDAKCPLVLALDEDECKYSSLCGAKAASLAQMRGLKTSSHFFVPNGVSLTRFAYDAIKENNPFLAKHIDRLAKIVGDGNRSIIEAECAKMEKFVTTKDKIKIPDRLLDELRQSLEKHSSLENHFAVRSSSWGEDEDGMSAAGQLTTLLSIKGLDRIGEAILECYGSKFSYTNIEYKRNHGLPMDMPMAVVIQEMVNCDKAGVMFTCDPRSGDPRQVLITANYGLGESVVSAAADPDSILVNVSSDGSKVLGIKEISIGKKDVIVSGDEKREKEQQNEKVYDRSRCCLVDEEIVRLAECGLELARYFQNDRDVEWGFKDGQLHLFQSRPVTGLDVFSRFELLHEFDYGMEFENSFLSRANVGEVMPTAVTPVCQKMFFALWGLVTQEFYHNTRCCAEDIWYSQRRPGFPTFGHYVFLSLIGNPFFMFGGDGRKNEAKRAGEVGIFGREINDPDLIFASNEIKFSRQKWAKFYQYYYTFPYRWATLRCLQRDQEFIDQCKEMIYKMETDRYGMKELYDNIEWLSMTTAKPFMAHLKVLLIVPSCTERVLNLLSKYIRDDPVRLFTAYSKLLASCPDVFSAGVPRELESICDGIAKNTDDLRKFLDATSMDNNDEALAFLNSNSNCKDKFKSFMGKFGHRAWNEFDPYQSPWREDPTTIIHMLRQSCRDRLTRMEMNDGTERANAKPKAKSVDEAIASLKLNLKSSDEKKLKRLVARSQLLVGARERSKNLSVHIVDIYRILIRQLGQKMFQEGRIPDKDLVFFFTMEELEKVVASAQPGLVGHAQLRRRLHQTIGGWKFEELIKGHEVIPLHMKRKDDNENSEGQRLLPKLTGTTASSGCARGPVRVVNDYSELNKLISGDILVTYSTDISYSPAFPLLAGIITEIGGLVSHGAVIAREYGLPSIIGVQDATKILRDGEQIILDGDNGEIVRLETQS